MAKNLMTLDDARQRIERLIAQLEYAVGKPIPAADVSFRDNDVENAAALRLLLAAAEAGEQTACIAKALQDTQKELDGERDVRQRIERHNHDLQRAVASRPSGNERADR